jgi:hypothetical protein
VVGAGRPRGGSIDVLATDFVLVAPQPRATKRLTRGEDTVLHRASRVTEVINRLNRDAAIVLESR